MTKSKPAEADAKREAKRRSAAAAKEAAAARAIEIRQKLANARAVMPGTIMGGESGWRYSVIPSDCTTRTRDMARKSFEAKGFDKVTDGHATVAGHVDPEIWRIPEEIYAEMMQAQAND